MNVTAEGNIEEYDSTGAISYVVIVIIVYGTALFILLFSMITRKPYHKRLDVELRNYENGLQNAFRQEMLKDVMLTRISYPGNYICVRDSRKGRINKETSSTIDIEPEIILNCEQ